MFGDRYEQLTALRGHPNRPRYGRLPAVRKGTFVRHVVERGAWDARRRMPVQHAQTRVPTMRDCEIALAFESEANARRAASP